MGKWVAFATGIYAFDSLDEALRSFEEDEVYYYEEGEYIRMYTPDREPFRTYVVEDNELKMVDKDDNRK